MKLMNLVLIVTLPFLLSNSYQVGEKWDKKHINKASSKSQVLKESVGEVGARATLFYIGKYNGKYWAITNNHVCPNIAKTNSEITNKCDGQWVKFFYYKNKRGVSLEGAIKSVPLIVKNLDLALVELVFNNLDQFERAPTALKFSDQIPFQGQELISVGYGVQSNDYGTLRIEESSFDCRVFSKNIKLTKDPDTLNPISYSVHSFLHGCDVSHGDSGSPILNRETYEVAGLLWTGKYPKHRSISQEGFDLLPLSFLWKELNYAAPGFLIKTELEAFFNSSLGY